MVSIDRLYHKTNAIADLESWGCALSQWLFLSAFIKIWIKLQEDIYTVSTLGLTTIIMILLLPFIYLHLHDQYVM